MRERPLLNAEVVPGASEFGLSRLKLFLALSRTPHGLLDLAAPALAALLWLGRFPPLGVTALGLLTVFAGYTAVYALNDVVDYRVDREKLRLEGPQEGHYLDAVFVRHPLAAGRVSFPEGLGWTGAWALVALLGAYALNPVCALIFLGGCLLETAYCLLLKVSHLRLLVAGVVKSLGAVAAVFAVDPRPSPIFLAVLFLWLFFWEMGGQNIPADWHDVEQDRSLDSQDHPGGLGPATGRGPGSGLFDRQPRLQCGHLAAGSGPLLLLPAVADGGIRDLSIAASRLAPVPEPQPEPGRGPVQSGQLLSPGGVGRGPDKFFRLSGMGASEDFATMATKRQGGPGPEDEGRSRALPPWLTGLVARYPYLRRHPHPAVSHFPIVFMLAASFFSVLYLLTRVTSFETTAFHCLGGGVLSTPAAIATGVFTQRLNYPQPDPTLTLEKRLSYLLWAMVSGAFVWRLLDPEVLRNLHGLNFFYLLLVLAVTPLVTVISFFGGMLTFPLESEGKISVGRPSWPPTPSRASPAPPST